MLQNSQDLGHDQVPQSWEHLRLRIQEGRVEIRPDNFFWMCQITDEL